MDYPYKSHKFKTYQGNCYAVQVRHFIPSNILRMFYFSLFKPHTDYCFSVSSSTSQTNLEPIAIAMRKAICILSFRASDAHSDPLFKTQNYLTFNS